MPRSEAPKVTVILPTTTDRGALLPFSVGSVLNQDLRELELFIIGDGVSDATRIAIEDLMEEDSRIRFFDHPKHPRRGEVYRHAALREARGEVVAYICDRDIFLPNHLSTLYGHLKNHDFVSTNLYDVDREQRITIGAKRHGYGTLSDLTDPEVSIGAHKLSSVGHTLAAYRKLPEGWRTTPDDQATDRYMWRQFLAEPDLKVHHSPHPTFLYFKRGTHPGWPTEKRRVELAHWWSVINDASAWESARAEAMGNFVTDHARLELQQRDTIRIRGQLPVSFLLSIPQKIANRWRNRSKKKRQW